MITISLDENSGEPMYIQIYEYIKKEILSGRLSAPEKLPSARSLASHLQVSRSTVDTAYEQLVAEGYIDPREKRGYFVNPITHTQVFSLASTRQRASTEVRENAASVPYDFDPDNIDTTHFPYSVWKSLGKNQLDNPDNFVKGDALGDAGLRSTICDYLHGSRGVLSDPDRIVVGAGMSHLLQMLCVLFDRKAVIAMEDPGYRNARQIFLSNGYSVLDIPLQAGSFDVDRLSQTAADICYVTPSHQFPMGSVLPISRRQRLLAWAREGDRYIIEDDHDSEFRYKGRPIPALQSLEKKPRVIYIGTFSKAVSPAVRTGYMVLPEELMAKYRDICRAYSCPVSRTTQAILTDFIREGYFEKHLNRMRKNYKGKHDTIIEAIEKYLRPEEFEISGDHAGLYILLRYRGSLTEQEIEKRAEKNGIRLRSLRGYYAHLPADYLPTWLLGFANLTPEQITEGIRILAEKVFL